MLLLVVGCCWLCLQLRYLTDCLGCRSIDQYTSEDAAKLRDWFVSRGLASASIQRNFGSIKAIVNFVILEKGLNCSNPFNGVYLHSDNSSKKRKPIPLDKLKILQERCVAMDDDLRHLVSLNIPNLAVVVGKRRLDLMFKV